MIPTELCCEPEPSRLRESVWLKKDPFFRWRKFLEKGLWDLKVHRGRE